MWSEEQQFKLDGLLQRVETLTAKRAAELTVMKATGNDASFVRLGELWNETNNDIGALLKERGDIR